MKPICICAAIKDTDGNIWRGHRHADAMSTAVMSGAHLPFSHDSQWQGFITSENKFVNRIDGMKLQLDAGIPSAYKGGYRGNLLYSEDLY